MAAKPAGAKEAALRELRERSEALRKRIEADTQMVKAITFPLKLKKKGKPKPKAKGAD